MNRFLKATLWLAAYIPILLVIYTAYIRIFPVDVVLYSSIFASLIASAITAALLVILTDFTALEKVQMALIYVLVGYIFSISVPTVIDRSLSFYILEKLQQRGGGIQREHFDFVFVEEYLPEHRLIDIRITEQVESGTIVLDGNCVRLTARGELLAKGSRYFRTHFLPKRRLIAGEYTDDLTDPFRTERQVPDYRC